MSAAVEWPFSPAPQWIQNVDGWLVDFLCPVCFIAFGTHVAPLGRRTVAVVLAVAYFGFIIAAAMQLGQFGNITSYGRIGLLISLFPWFPLLQRFFGTAEQAGGA